MTHWLVVITLPSIHFRSIQLGIIESKSYSTLRASSNTMMVSSAYVSLLIGVKVRRSTPGFEPRSPALVRILSFDINLNYVGDQTC